MKSNIKTSTGKDIAVRRKARQVAAQTALLTLKGKSIELLSKKEVDVLLVAIGQLLDIVDDSGKII